MGELSDKEGPQIPLTGYSFITHRTLANFVYSNVRIQVHLTVEAGADPEQEEAEAEVAEEAWVPPEQEEAVGEILET